MVFRFGVNNWGKNKIFLNDYDSEFIQYIKTIFEQINWEIEIYF